MEGWVGLVGWRSRLALQMKFASNKLGDTLHPNVKLTGEWLTWNILLVNLFVCMSLLVSGNSAGGGVVVQFDIHVASPPYQSINQLFYSAPKSLPTANLVCRT